MSDPTEDIRKQMLADINAAPGSREIPGTQARASLGTPSSCPMTSTCCLRRPAGRRPQEERRSEGQPDVPGVTPVLLRL